MVVSIEPTRTEEVPSTPIERGPERRGGESFRIGIKIAGQKSGPSA